MVGKNAVNSLKLIIFMNWNVFSGKVNFRFFIFEFFEVDAAKIVCQKGLRQLQRVYTPLLISLIYNALCCFILLKKGKKRVKKGKNRRSND
jgi:hypothetical protein